MSTETVTLAVRPEMTGSPIDTISMFPPSCEAVMPTLIAVRGGENAMAIMGPLSKSTLAAVSSRKRMVDEAMATLVLLLLHFGKIA